MTTTMLAAGDHDEGNEMAKVPNTISDADWTDIRRRAEKIQPPFFSAEAIRRRKAASAQARNAHLN